VTTENDLLRAARERISSPSCPDEALSRQELADRVNAYIYNHHKRIVALDAGYFGKLERGVIRWPGRLYREAPRAVLEVPTDAQLGFSSSHRTVVKVVGVNRGQAVCTAGLGLGGLALSAMAPVAALLEGDEPTPIPSRVGATDIEYIRDAAGVFESWDFRFRVMCQIKLASLTMVTGDPVEAATLGTAALEAVGAIRSHQAIDELRQLARHATQHSVIDEADELHHRITTAVLT
jgi:hypothetical protein